MFLCSEQRNIPYRSIEKEFHCTAPCHEILVVKLDPQMFQRNLQSLNGQTVLLCTSLNTLVSFSYCTADLHDP